MQQVYAIDLVICLYHIYHMLETNSVTGFGLLWCNLKAFAHVLGCTVFVSWIYSSISIVYNRVEKGQFILIKTNSKISNKTIAMWIEFRIVSNMYLSAVYNLIFNLELEYTNVERAERNTHGNKMCVRSEWWTSSPPMDCIWSRDHSLVVYTLFSGSRHTTTTISVMAIYISWTYKTQHIQAHTHT